MKKALQIPHLRAGGSVSDGAVVRRSGERRFYDFRDRFAQVWIHNLGRDRSSLPRLLWGGLGRWRRERLRSRVGQRSGSEPKPRATWQTFRDLGRALSQLEAPDRVAHMD